MDGSGRAVVCRFCGYKTTKAGAWLGHCRDEGCWYLYCERCCIKFRSPTEAFEHHQKERCTSYGTNTGDWHGHCCGLTYTRKKPLNSHCYHTHGGRSRCDAWQVIPCKCRRFYGDEFGYNKHIETLGDSWFCKTCDTYTKEAPQCGHKVKHVWYEEDFEAECGKLREQNRSLVQEMGALKIENAALKIEIETLKMQTPSAKTKLTDDLQPDLGYDDADASTADADASTADDARASTADESKMFTADGAKAFSLVEAKKALPDDANASTADESKMFTADDAKAFSPAEAKKALPDDANASAADESNAATADDARASTPDEALTSILLPPGAPQGVC
ncbi:hypothetical protein GNI_033610 [Gregarina niphandrodes]|uniref:Uncharacterized protein n=1 Tax=Gregarina niphandrodes TaxID=110365 RepID=A0A023BB23_GRENI|nr:hypothetical protein GNI_033610 [Gregarina niphandrodes]EZG78657.1 hypothetical protein GNI_033610 [Gregarina niphandrodes]|eukprot:XP_011129215.1 hypothetical protein GNI_033610 [Gregarina niphandrodes]